MNDKSEGNCIEKGKSTDLTKSWPTQQGAHGARTVHEIESPTEQKCPGPRIATLITLWLVCPGRVWPLLES